MMALPDAYSEGYSTMWHERAWLLVQNSPPGASAKCHTKLCAYHIKAHRLLCLQTLFCVIAECLALTPTQQGHETGGDTEAQ